MTVASDHIDVLLPARSCYQYHNSRRQLTDAFHAPGACFLQVAALHACCNFINSLDEANEREVFQPMIVPMLTALGRCLSASDEASAQDVLELLIEVAENYPKFLRKHLQEVVSAMMQVGYFMCQSLAIVWPMGVAPGQLMVCGGACTIGMVGPL